MRGPPILLFILLMSFHATPLEAQNFSGLDREAWATVSRGWEALRAKDVDGFVATLHPEFLGWNMSRPLPLDLVAERSGTMEFFASYDWISYEINPLAVQVTDDVAIVMYRYHEVVRSSKDATVHEEIGRALQILKRHDGAWKTLSIMSGPAS